MELTFEQEDFISEKHEEKLLEMDDHHDDDDYDFASWLAERSKEDRAIILAEMEERVFAPLPKQSVSWVDDDGGFNHDLPF